MTTVAAKLGSRVFSGLSMKSDQPYGHLKLPRGTGAYDALLKGPQNPEARKEIAALERVERSYTMNAERRLHEAAVMSDYLEPVPIEAADDEADSVTLF